MSGPAILVTVHAVDRARQRFPELELELERKLRDRIRLEVIAALAADRVACRRPRWVVRHGGQRWRARSRSQRYVWTPDERRCYVIDRRHGDVVVLTTLAGPEELAP